MQQLLHVYHKFVCIIRITNHMRYSDVNTMVKYTCITNF